MISANNAHIRWASRTSIVPVERTNISPNTRQQMDEQFDRLIFKETQETGKTTPSEMMRRTNTSVRVVMEPGKERSAVDGQH